MEIDDGEESILQEAYRLTHGPRNADYGHPLDNFEHTAGLVNALLGHKFKQPLTAEDVVAIMRMVKESRQRFQPKRDNQVDIAGYAWVEQAIVEERARRALDSVSDDRVWRAQQQANDAHGARIEPQWPDNAGAGAPAVPTFTGRLQLACGCFGMCTCPPIPVGVGPVTLVPPATIGPKDPSGKPYMTVAKSERAVMESGDWPIPIPA